MKTLIVNADDFGMSREVNEGVKKGVEAGVIKSVSVMVNMPYFNEAVLYLKKHQEVSVGLHLNLTEGMPISTSNQTSTLIREDGHFFHWIGFVINLLTRKVKYSEVEVETNMQFEKLKRTGIKISHIDSHHHVHLYPSIFKLLIKFVKKNDIKAPRCRPFRLSKLIFSLRKLRSFKQFIILFLCFIDSRFFSNAKEYYDVEQIIDISWDPHFNEKRFENLLKELPDGVTEVICHPAILSKSGNRKFLEPRYNGLKLLLNQKIRRIVKTYHIEYSRRK